MEDPWDFQIHPRIFKHLTLIWGPFLCDLFASLWNTQISQFYSWKHQPLAKGIDALAHPWNKKGNYAFPPWNQIHKIIKKIKREECQLCLITPYYQTQPWFSSLVNLCIDSPIKIIMAPDSLTDAQGLPHPLITQNKLSLIGWRLSGCKLDREAFLSQLPKSSKILPGKRPQKPINTNGLPGVIGVIQGRYIHFNPTSLI